MADLNLDYHQVQQVDPAAATPAWYCQPYLDIPSSGFLSLTKAAYWNDLAPAN